MAGSGAIAYSAKLQSRVVPSSKDAEFNAAYLCIQHMKKLQGLLKELGFPQTKTILFMDNLSCTKTFIGDNDGDLDFSSDALELHMIREAKKQNNSMSYIQFISKGQKTHKNSEAHPGYLLWLCTL